MASDSMMNPAPRRGGRWPRSVHDLRNAALYPDTFTPISGRVSPAGLDLGDPRSARLLDLSRRAAQTLDRRDRLIDQLRDPRRRPPYGVTLNAWPRDTSQLTDPHIYPDTFAPIADPRVSPTGVDLTDPRAAEILELGRAAAALLDERARLIGAMIADAAAPGTAPFRPMPKTSPGMTPSTASTPRQRFNVQILLLAIGIALVSMAVLVFAALTYSMLDDVQRGAAIAAIAAIALTFSYALHERLRITAEGVGWAGLIALTIDAHLVSGLPVFADVPAEAVAGPAMMLVSCIGMGLWWSLRARGRDPLRCCTLFAAFASPYALMLTLYGAFGFNPVFDMLFDGVSTTRLWAAMLGTAMVAVPVGAFLPAHRRGSGDAGDGGEDGVRAPNVERNAVIIIGMVFGTVAALAVVTLATQPRGPVTVLVSSLLTTLVWLTFWPFLHRRFSTDAPVVPALTLPAAALSLMPVAPAIDELVFAGDVARQYQDWRFLIPCAEAAVFACAFAALSHMLRNAAQKKRSTTAPPRARETHWRPSAKECEAGHVLGGIIAAMALATQTLFSLPAILTVLIDVPLTMLVSRWPSPFSSFKPTPSIPTLVTMLLLAVTLLWLSRTLSRRFIIPALVAVTMALCLLATFPSDRATVLAAFLLLPCVFAAAVLAMRIFVGGGIGAATAVSAPSSTSTPSSSTSSTSRPQQYRPRPQPRQPQQPARPRPSYAIYALRTLQCLSLLSMISLAALNTNGHDGMAIATGLVAMSLCAVWYLVLSNDMPEGPRIVAGLAIVPFIGFHAMNITYATQRLTNLGNSDMTIPRYLLWGLIMIGILALAAFAKAEGRTVSLRDSERTGLMLPAGVCAIGGMFTAGTLTCLKGCGTLIDAIPFITDPTVIILPQLVALCSLAALAAIAWLDGPPTSNRRQRAIMLAAIALIGVLVIAATNFNALVFDGRTTYAPVTPPELPTLTLAVAMLVAGGIRMRRNVARRSWKELGPGLLTAMLPSLLLTWIVPAPLGVRIVIVGTMALAAIIVGGVRGLQAPLVCGTVVMAIHVFVRLWPAIRAFSADYWWVWLALAGIALIVVAAFYERSLKAMRTLGRRIRDLR